MTRVIKVLLTLGFVLLVTQTSVYAKTAATVNGMKITVNEANKALKVLTKGKMTWSKLPKNGKKQLIDMLAPSKLVAATAKKQLTSKEKSNALSAYWMQKKMKNVKVSDAEAKKAYKKMKKVAKATKSKRKIPPFSKIKNQLKMQLKQEKVVTQLMKHAKIRLK